MKFCPKCQITKNINDFNKNKAKPDGLQSQCRQCSNTNSKEHYSEHKTRYVKRNKSYKKRNMLEFLNYMENKSCFDCGISDVRVLEFDHLRDKSFNISEKVATSPLSTLMSEIEKCQIVCANCHRIRTAISQNWYNYKE